MESALEPAPVEWKIRRQSRVLQPVFAREIMNVGVGPGAETDVLVDPVDQQKDRVHGCRRSQVSPEHGTAGLVFQTATAGATVRTVQQAG